MGGGGLMQLLWKKRRARKSENKFRGSACTQTDEIEWFGRRRWCETDGVDLKTLYRADEDETKKWEARKLRSNKLIGNSEHFFKATMEKGVDVKLLDDKPLRFRYRPTGELCSDVSDDLKSSLRDLKFSPKKAFAPIDSNEGFYRAKMGNDYKLEHGALLVQQNNVIKTFRISSKSRNVSGASRSLMKQTTNEENAPKTEVERIEELVRKLKEHFNGAKRPCNVPRSTYLRPNVYFYERNSNKSQLVRDRSCRLSQSKCQNY
ncbi:PREDICTED: uncharacterized protein LOC108556658 isoform X2 [Nicrophorus vespilloides]|uniref:Uncharacterized protein LOC108556658 isoform X2 n=1 Tax=Nicrophorus vespilloides TaxID=110193 RepID=A0ABM1M199_NICVS|nr:PREDICTED: uncharacterized protein LOC108556658 isoform X2 [Nicrophorus vespilloides]